MTPSLPSCLNTFHEKAVIVKQQFVVLDREEETSSAVLPSALWWTRSGPVHVGVRPAGRCNLRVGLECER